MKNSYIVAYKLFNHNQYAIAMRIKLLLPIVGMFMLPVFVLAQKSEEILPEYAQGTPLPEAMFSPTAPNVREMIRYGNAAVNMYTGAVSYDINLYTYSDKFFTIPISAKYNCNGYKPSMRSGIVGMGWYLDVGGAITREVRGLPDEATSREYANKNKGDQSLDNVYAIAGSFGYGHAALKQMLSDYYRNNNVLIFGYGARTVSVCQLSEPDFAYSGEIGKEYVLFREEKDDHSTTRKFELESDIYHFSFMGYSGSFILGEDCECIVLNSNKPAGEIRIVYNYDKESPLSTSFIIRTGEGTTYAFNMTDICSSSSDWGVDGYSPESEDMISCWHLTEIKTRDGMSVEFKYGISDEKSTVINAISLDDLTVTDSGGRRQEKWIGNGLYRKGQITNSVRQRYLTQIRIPERVNINFSYDDGLLSSLMVTNMNKKTVRSCSFTYKAFGSQTLMKKLWLSGEGEYAMDYYEESRDVDIMPSLPTWKEDWYGYYSSDVTIPEYKSGDLKEYSLKLISDKNRFNFEDARMLMLKRMTYPLGGYADYSYEANSYTMKSGGKVRLPETITGGVRVSRIDTYDSDGLLHDVKSYAYELEQKSCSGVLYEEPHIYYRYSLTAPTLTIDREVVSSMSGTELLGGVHIGYTRVLEKMYDKEGRAMSLTEHIFAPEGSGPYTEMYKQSSSDVITKEGWTFQFEDRGCDFTQSQEMNGSLIGGMELRQTLFEESESSSRKSSLKENSISYWHPSMLDSVIVIPSVFHGKIYNRTYQRYSPYIRKTAETKYGTDGTAMLVRVYEIMEINDKGRACKFMSTDSKGQQMITSLTFMNTYPSCMIGKSTMLGGKVISDERYDYSYFSSSGKGSSLYPSSIRRGLISPSGEVTGYEAVLTVKSYDSYGNPKEVVDIFGNSIEYEWGYSGLYMTMKTVRAGGRRICWFWTWEPLIGMTSATLPDMATTLYGMDEFGRLTSVIESGDIIGKYEYNIISE